MFDPRTDLPEIIEGEFREVTIQEHYQALIDEAKTRIKSQQYQRRLVDEMVAYIEEHLLDELTDMGDVDSFVFLGSNLLELRLMSKARSYSVREQACREVWFKYNH